MANDLLSALRTYLSKVSGGEKSPQEVAAALNTWARESSEAIKSRVEDELKRSASKMGFAKQSEVDRISRELEELKSRLVTIPRETLLKNAQKISKSTETAAKKSKAKKPIAKKPIAKKPNAKKPNTKKSSAKKSTRKAVKRVGSKR